MSSNVSLLQAFPSTNTVLNAPSRNTSLYPSSHCNSHIGIIYGDGCTLNNVKQVWEELKKKGFAANNIVFGVGAFCFSAVIEPDGYMVVVTRDMFGIAMKATYGIVNGEPIMIYKDPKTDTSHLKKSHKGCCCIYYDDNGELQCEAQ